MALRSCRYSRRGQHKFIYLELQPEMVASIARQAGFETKAKDSPRTIHLDLSAPARQGPLLLFDAADPAIWAGSRAASFMWTGARAAVMQTPMTLANKRDRGGKAQFHAVRLTDLQGTPCQPSGCPATSR